MQRPAFIIALFSLFSLFSLALASPLPMRVRKEAREATAELGARGIFVDRKILHREAMIEIGSGVSPNILARGDETSGDYPQGVIYGTNDAKNSEKN